MTPTSILSTESVNCSPLTRCSVDREPVSIAVPVHRVPKSLGQVDLRTPETAGRLVLGSRAPIGMKKFTRFFGGEYGCLPPELADYQADRGSSLHSGSR